jgi:recombination protein RecT
MANELMNCERTQEGFLALAQNIIKNENRIISGNYDLPKAMTSVYTNLMTTKTSSGKLAIETCSDLSIKDAITYCIQNELTPSKSQGYFIPYGNELKFMPSYFGLVKMAKDLCGVNIVSNVIRDGEQADVTTRSDGVMIISHKPSIKCLNNKIVAVYSIATHIGSGRVVYTNLMSTEEAKKSWAKSQTGCKVGKEFEHEMLIRTSERRTAKHLINKSGDGMMLSITNEDGTVTPIDESYLANPIDVQYTIDAEFMNEDISKESARFEPTEADVISADDLKLETITPVMDAPDGAIEIPYAEYKNNKEKYSMIANSYNPSTKTCMVQIIEQ